MTSSRQFGTMRHYLHHCSMFWALMSQDANTEAHYQIRRRLAVVIVGLLTAAGLMCSSGSSLDRKSRWQRRRTTCGILLGVIFSMLLAFRGLEASRSAITADGRFAGMPGRLGNLFGVGDSFFRNHKASSIVELGKIYGIHWSADTGPHQVEGWVELTRFHFLSLLVAAR